MGIILRRTTDDFSRDFKNGVTVEIEGNIFQMGSGSMLKQVKVQRLSEQN